MPEKTSAAIFFYMAEEEMLFWFQNITTFGTFRLLSPILQYKVEVNS